MQARESMDVHPLGFPARRDCGRTVPNARLQPSHCVPDTGMAATCRKSHAPNLSRGGSSSKSRYTTEMNKDNIEGRVKDVAGRVRREAGEASGDKEQKAHGTEKQADGKVQDSASKVKEAAKHAAERVNKTAHDKDKDKDAA
jgi:uncharacterized protein YjbJ (UPF0337 family)